MRPLRIVALAVLLASAAAALWLWLGSPGTSQDLYYAAARARQGMPFAGVAAVTGLLVYVAGGTARSYGRWAAASLWLILLGALSLVGALLVEMELWPPLPHRVIEYTDAVATRMLILSTAMAGGALCLLAGVALWLLSYRLDRRRGAP
jgi:hypothetical protein